MSAEQAVAYVCAFCGKRVANPIAVYADWAWGAEEHEDGQMWPAHKDCFIAALCESARDRLQ